MGRGDDGIKCIEVRTLLQKGAYEEALEVVETINIDRIKSIVNLKAIASVYERVGEYERAKDVLLQSYDIKRTKMTVYRLAYLSVKTGEFDDAEAFYEEFTQMAPESPDRYILRYGIDRAKNVDYVLRIATLQKLKQIEYTEEWGYELAKIYHKAGLHDECIRECKDLILWFGSGVIVDKARLLCKYHEEGRESLDAYGVFEQDVTPEELQERRERFQSDTADLQAQAEQVEEQAREQELRRQIDLDMEKTVDLRQVMESEGDQFDLLKQEVHRVWGNATQQQEKPEFIDHEEPVMEPVSEIEEEPYMQETSKAKVMSRRETENMLAASLAKVMDKANRGELFATPQVKEIVPEESYEPEEMFDPAAEYEQQNYADMQEIFADEMPVEPDMLPDAQTDAYETEQMRAEEEDIASQVPYDVEAEIVEPEVPYDAEVENVEPEAPYGAEAEIVEAEASYDTEVEADASHRIEDETTTNGATEEVQTEEPELLEKMSRHQRRNARRAAKREKQRLAKEKKAREATAQEVDMVEVQVPELTEELSEVRGTELQSTEEISEGKEIEAESAETKESEVKTSEVEESEPEGKEEMSDVAESEPEGTEGSEEVEEAKTEGTGGTAEVKEAETESTEVAESEVEPTEENAGVEQQASQEETEQASEPTGEEDDGLESDFVNEYGMVLWEYFEKYQNDTRLCEDVYRALEQIVKGKKPRNFIITCKNAERYSDFGRTLAKALKAIGVTEKSAARITAEKLNRMHLEQNYDKLKGSCLMVEECRKMTADTAQSIMNMINEMPDDIIVFLCDARPYVKDIMDEYPMMKRYFPFDIAMK